MTLYSTLLEVKGLKGLKEEHLESLSWKVRQTCFVALLDELGGSVETERRKLRQLVESRADATRSLRDAASRTTDGRDFARDPPSQRLNIGSAAVSDEAFRAAFMKALMLTIKRSIRTLNRIM